MTFFFSNTQRHIQARVHQLRVKLNWTAEAKVLTVLVYYILLGTVVLTILTNSLTDLGSFYREATNYFLCEQSGIPSNSNCSRSKLEGLVNPITTAVAFVLMGLYPAVSLVYVINIKDLKMLTTKRKVEVAQRENHQRGNIQSIMVLRPGVVGGGGPGSGGTMMNSSLIRGGLTPARQDQSNLYLRPSTFNPRVT